MAAVDEAKYGKFAQIINQIISDNNINIKKRSKTPAVDYTVVE